VKYALIASQERSRSLTRINQCRLLSVTRSAFYKSLKCIPTKRALFDSALLPTIRRIHAESGETYGVPLIREALAKEGIPIGKARVGRLMRSAGLVAKGRRRASRRVAVRPQLYAGNKLARDFSPGPPDRRWSADITYLPSREGVAYLATVLDIGTRMVVGWAWSVRRDDSLSLSALEMALTRRIPAAGLIHHADQGGQYWSADYKRALSTAGLDPSCSGRAACADNAVIESFFGTLKSQCPALRSLPPTREAAALAAIDWIETWYNRRRLHSTLGYETPLDYERMQIKNDNH
jgi:putative transposase